MSSNKNVHGQVVVAGPGYTTGRRWRLLYELHGASALLVDDLTTSVLHEQHYAGLISGNDADARRRQYENTIGKYENTIGKYANTIGKLEMYENQEKLIYTVGSSLALTALS